MIRVTMNTHVCEHLKKEKVSIVKVGEADVCNEGEEEGQNVRARVRVLVFGPRVIGKVRFGSWEMVMALIRNLEMRF